MNAQLILTNPDDAYEERTVYSYLGDPPERGQWLRSSFVTWPGRAKLEVVCNGCAGAGKLLLPEHPYGNATKSWQPCVCEGGFVAPSSGDTYRDVAIFGLIDPMLATPRTLAADLEAERTPRGVADAVHVIERPTSASEFAEAGWFPSTPRSEWWAMWRTIETIPDTVDQMFYAAGVTP